MESLSTLDIKGLMALFLTSALMLSSVIVVVVIFVLRESLLAKPIWNEWVDYRNLARAMLVSLGLGLLTTLITMAYLWVESFLCLAWRQVFAIVTVILLLSVIVTMFVALIRLAKKVLKNP